MLRRAHYLNYRLADFISDRDSSGGAPLGTLEVVRGER
jgi:hypothetical protein